MFLKSTVSTLNPMVGMVVKTSPSLSRYRIVVFPAASSPTIRMRMGRRGHSLANGSDKHEKSLDIIGKRGNAGASALAV